MDSALLSALAGLIPFAGFPAPVIGSEGHSPSAEGQPPKTLTTGVTLPLVAVGTAGAASFAEVDKTMQLTNKTMGNSEEEAQKLNKAMKDAASNSTFGMKDAATATLNFARAGLDAEQAYLYFRLH